MENQPNIVVRRFQWEDWSALWQLRAAQLAEQGILMNQLPTEPEPDSPYETDYHRIEPTYLTGRGGFWLAWWFDLPVGHVGAQDVGGCVELRRMYVRAEHRRRGVGSRLVESLIRHCIEKEVKAIELWTSPRGPGRSLYERLGFRVSAGRGREFDEVSLSPDEIRMRLDLPRSGEAAPTAPTQREY